MSEEQNQNTAAANETAQKINEAVETGNKVVTWLKNHQFISGIIVGAVVVAVLFIVL